MLILFLSFSPLLLVLQSEDEEEERAEVAEEPARAAAEFSFESPALAAAAATKAVVEVDSFSSDKEMRTLWERRRQAKRSLRRWLDKKLLIQKDSNNVEREIKKQDEKNCTFVVTFMDGMLKFSNNGSLGNECYIYKIPEFILKGREYFYRPLVMSIGPVHYCKDTKLQLMQDVKWIYLNRFLQKTNNGDNASVHPYIKFVKDNEMKIRGCYQEKNSLSSDELAKIIVLDAAFLIYTIMNYGRTDENSFKLPEIENKLQAALPYSYLDLFRLENQIPYFVLKGIYDIAFGKIDEANTFINATLTFIGRMSVGILGSKAVESIIKEKIIDETNILHLLDLQRKICCYSSSSSTNQPANKKTDDLQMHTATQLKDAGVTFAKGDNKNPLDITFDCGKLTISRLIIEDFTEDNLRNLVYFEQCHHSGDSYFIDYVFFLDNLINTVEDVQVLIEYKIFINDLGSNTDVVNLFNNICKNVFFNKDDSKYSKVISNLNHYASKRRNQWMAILRTKYFNHPWVILSVIAAFALFVLTLLQTTAAFIYK